MNDQFFFGAVWDALSINARCVDNVFAYYDDLNKKVENLMVLNQIPPNGNIALQRVNITTYFGHGDSAERTKKEFVFDTGSTLLYLNDLNERSDVHEVANLGSVQRMIASLTNISETGEYMPISGNAVNNPYTFTKEQTFSGGANFSSAKINGFDIATKQYVDNRLRDTPSSDGLTLLGTSGGSTYGDHSFYGRLVVGGYDVSPFVSQRLVVHDSEAVGGVWRMQVAGGVNAAPLDYTLYFADGDLSMPLSQSQLPHWAYVQDGALWLGINTSSVNIFVPWTGATIGDATDGLSVYLVARIRSGE